MQTKELSRQLCELCGIKPKIQCVTCPYFDIEAPECSYKHYEQYPDFSKPENFLKLFNLKFITSLNEEKTFAQHISKTFVATKDEKEFIKQLIHQLETSFEKKAMKQSIREAEWVYE